MWFTDCSCMVVTCLSWLSHACHGCHMLVTCTCTLFRYEPGHSSLAISCVLGPSWPKCGGSITSSTILQPREEQGWITHDVPPWFSSYTGKYHEFVAVCTVNYQCQGQQKSDICFQYSLVLWCLSCELLILLHVQTQHVTCGAWYKFSHYL